MERNSSFGIEVTLGPDRLSEPFATWTDGAYTVLRRGQKVMAIPPTNLEAIHRHVWVGTDMDDLVPTVAVSEPPLNSHRHRGHVFDAGCWFCGLWVDESDVWYAFVHCEDRHDIADWHYGWGNDLRTICLFVSQDQGATWSYERPIVTISDRFPMPPATQTAYPVNGGAGDHKLVVSPDRDFLYLLYTNFTYEQRRDEDHDNAIGNLAIARCGLLPGGIPGPWFKYFEGGFDSPGVGGDETWLTSPANGDHDNSQRTVTWSTYLNCYVMVFSPRSAGCRITFSQDLLHWEPSVELLAPGDVGLHYFNLIDTSPLGTDTVMGHEGLLYYTRADYEVHRRLLRFKRASRQTDAAGAVTVVHDPSLAVTERRPPGPQSFSSTDAKPWHDSECDWGYAAVAPLRPHGERTEWWSAMSFDEASSEWRLSGTESAIGREWIQAAENVEAARYWRAPWSGRIRLTFEARHISPAAGASALRVQHNRTRVWPADRPWHFLTAGGVANVELVLDVCRGDRVFMVVGAPQADTARVSWIARLETDPG